MLSILIPTYNRAHFLVKNLYLLEDIIIKCQYEGDINIIISNNCSTDSTKEELEKIQINTNIKIIIYEQERNIGLQANALFTLSKCISPYVMYLGDDDYITSDYLEECMHIIKKDTSTSLIIPNYVPVSIEEKIIESSRQPLGPTLVFQAGFKSILENSWKGHQLSGILLKRENLLEDYHRYGVNNIYLFIFFVAISGLKGSTYLITQSPVKVTQPVQKKDWGYGDDGLINEIFDNYAKLPVTPFQRFQLEFMFLYQQWWRLTMYKQQGWSAFFKAFRKITFSKNASFLFSLSTPISLILIKLRLFLK